MSCPSIPAAPVTSTRFNGGRCRRVADHEAVGARRRECERSCHVAADQARLDPGVEVLHAAVLQQDAVLDLGPADRDPADDRGVRADVGVLDHAACPDDRPVRGWRSARARARLDHDAPRSCCRRPARPPCGGADFEDQAVGLQQVVQLAHVLPPSLHDVRLDPQSPVDQRLDRVGDLELVAPRGLDRRAESKITGVNM